MNHPHHDRRATAADWPSPALDDPSFETTLAAARRYVEVAALIPRGSVVNVAFVEPADLPRRLRVIDELLAAGLTPRPIISTRRVESAGMLGEMLHEFGRVRRLRGLLVVGGDPATPAGPYATALELLRSAQFTAGAPEVVGLPGFPGHHPALAGGQLLDSLQQKTAAVQAGGRTVEITTQVCLDPGAMYRWITAVRARGIDAPIRVGIPTPSSLQRLLRFCRLCRAPVGAEDVVRWGWAGHPDAESADPAEFIASLRRLLEPGLGPVRLHVYPMGDLPAALRWLETLRQPVPDGVRPVG